MLGDGTEGLRWAARGPCSWRLLSAGSWALQSHDTAGMGASRTPSPTPGRSQQRVAAGAAGVAVDAVSVIFAERPE